LKNPAALQTVSAIGASILIDVRSLNAVLLDGTDRANS